MSRQISTPSPSSKSFFFCPLVFYCLHWDVIAMGAKCWLELIKMNEGTCHKQRQSQLLTERPDRPHSKSLSAGACPQDKTTSENENQAIATSSEKKNEKMRKIGGEIVTKRKLHKYFKSFASEWRHLSMECVRICGGACKTSHKL